MQHSWKLMAGIIALTIMVQAGPAAAHGGNCEELPLAADALVAAMDASQTLFDTLQTLDAELAIIGRVGSDLSGRGLKYSHAAFVWRDHPKGRWSVVHLLNLCGDGTGGLFEQGLVNFFLDDPFRLDVKLLVPTPDLQKGIVREIRSARALRLFQPEYSIWLCTSLKFNQLVEPSRNRLPPRISFAGTGLRSTACWISRRNSRPRDRDVRRLKRKVYSSR